MQDNNFVSSFFVVGVCVILLHAIFEFSSFTSEHFLFVAREREASSLQVRTAGWLHASIKNKVTVYRFVCLLCQVR